MMGHVAFNYFVAAALSHPFPGEVHRLIKAEFTVSAQGFKPLQIGAGGVRLYHQRQHAGIRRYYSFLLALLA